MVAALSLNPPIRGRKRRGQIAVLEELRDTSPKFDRMMMLRYPAKFVIYCGLFYLMVISPVMEWGVVWFAIIAGVGFTLVEELLWRFVMVPLMEREVNKLSSERKGEYEAILPAARTTVRSGTSCVSEHSVRDASDQGSDRPYEGPSVGIFRSD